MTPDPRLGFLAAAAIAAAAPAPASFLWEAPVSIANQTTRELLDHEVRIVLTASNFTTGYARMQPDGADLVVLDAEGNVLPHYTEDWRVGKDLSKSVVWVRVPRVAPFPQQTTLTLRLGNEDAASTSDPRGVFYLYDDFDDPAHTASIFTAHGTGTWRHEPHWTFSVPGFTWVKDPTLIRADDGRWWMYFTPQFSGNFTESNIGIAAACSWDLKDWHYYGKVKDLVDGEEINWAPDVTRDPVSGKHYMTYTGLREPRFQDGNHWISLAESTNLVDWTFLGRIYNPSNSWVIDPELWRDDTNGDWFLFYSRQVGSIWVARSTTGPQGPWSQHTNLFAVPGEVTEAPAVISQDGVLTMYYGVFDSAIDQRLFRATATSPFGPWTQHGQVSVTPSAEFFDQNIGHPDILKDGDSFLLVFHGENRNHGWDDRFGAATARSSTLGNTFALDPINHKLQQRDKTPGAFFIANKPPIANVAISVDLAGSINLPTDPTWNYALARVGAGAPSTYLQSSMWFYSNTPEVTTPDRFDVESALGGTFGGFRQFNNEGTGYIPGQWYRMEFRLDGTRVQAGTSSFNPDPTSSPYLPISSTSQSVVTQPGAVGLKSFFTLGEFENLVVRRFAFPEPSVTVGSIRPAPDQRTAWIMLQ